MQPVGEIQGFSTFKLFLYIANTVLYRVKLIPDIAAFTIYNSSSCSTDRTVMEVNCINIKLKKKIVNVENYGKL
jgi:hypothetical protein